MKSQVENQTQFKARILKSRRIDGNIQYLLEQNEFVDAEWQTQDKVPQEILEEYQLRLFNGQLLQLPQITSKQLLAPKIIKMQQNLIKEKQNKQEPQKNDKLEEIQLLTLQEQKLLFLQFNFYQRTDGTILSPIYQEYESLRKDGSFYLVNFLEKSLFNYQTGNEIQYQSPCKSNKETKELLKSFLLNGGYSQYKALKCQIQNIQQVTDSNSSSKSTESKLNDVDQEEHKSIMQESQKRSSHKNSEERKQSD